MRDASRAQEFEEAGHWRDLILSLEQIKDKPRFISIQAEEKDIVGFARRENEASLFVFLMRKGKVIQTQTVQVTNSLKEDDSAILSKHLVKFYEEQKILPEKIILPFRPNNYEEMSKNISILTERKITIAHPSKGKDRRLVDLANKNARMMLDKKPMRPSAIEEIKDILRLESAPAIIEGYDISNTGGQESVGSLVVFVNGSPHKQAYRKYKVKTVTGPNDVASLYEVLHRRFFRLKKEKDMLPDLILVDGGKGQLKAAKSALRELGIKDIPMISLAKKDEIIYSKLHPQGLRLDRTSPALQLVQQIRDEAHRFALAFHQQRRKKRSFVSTLDQIPGIGPKRKKLLLERYLSIADIRNASETELAQLIGTNTAQALVKYLKT
jgi:excinuclease ABC subunit C